MAVTWERERALGAGGGRRIAGVDEVGRGPLAGPVVAAAVILPPAPPPALLAGLADSKTLAAGVRESLDREIRAVAAVGLGTASVAEIDSLNILRASHVAMTRAVAALPAPPDLALVDGNRLPDLDCPAEAVVRGDARVASIAAAAVVAKVARDALMDALDRDFPAYGWAANRGYPTAAHRAALTRHGASIHHRRSFKPVRAVLGGST